MNLWIDTIDRLRFLGYSIVSKEGRLRYTYRGEGRPSSDEVNPLFNILRTYRGKVLNDPYFLIDQTLEEINRGYLPGAIEHMKQDRPAEWSKVISLEKEINRQALHRNRDKLIKVLNEYAAFLGDGE
jgi:hypothetical protein